MKSYTLRPDTFTLNFNVTLSGTSVKKLVDTAEEAGLTLIHKHNRAAGSTVVAFEDPSGVMIKKLKRCGHGVATLFSLSPEAPHKCQSGWQLSMTPYALRPVAKKGKGAGGASETRPALDYFVSDLVASQKELQASGKIRFMRSMFAENSFLACLIGGNLDPWILPLLNTPGAGREFTQMFVRRFFTAQLDCGEMRT